MSALRKAGVWLGLVEEDDDRRDDVFDDEFGDDDDDFAAPARPRSLTRPAPRGSDRRERDLRAADRDLRSGDRLSDRVSERSSDRLSDRSSDRLGDRVSDREQRIAEQRAAERAHRASEPESRAEPSRAETSRADPGRTERASVRQLARPTPSSSTSSGSGSGSTSYPTHDNLALAPQVQLRERAVVSDEKSRRYQITTLHPTTYNEARAIGEHFRDGYPVIMNLTEMDEADAKRLVDFAAGLAFGVRGSMERVTNRVFLLSPPNIQVSAEDKARIAEGGFFDQA
jgi:cell division inhibitor SepF